MSSDTVCIGYKTGASFINSDDLCLHKVTHDVVESCCPELGHQHSAKMICNNQWVCPVAQISLLRKASVAQVQQHSVSGYWQEVVYRRRPFQPHVDVVY
jgi:hypothetical protein